jgi:hypothetical protein
MDVSDTSGGQLIYGTQNQISYLIIGLLVGVGFGISAATSSSTGGRLILGAIAAAGFAQAVSQGREARSRRPLMRLDRDGVQAAVASVQWADLERIEIKSDAEDSHRTTIFVLRNDAQLQPGINGYNTSSGPRIKGSNLELYDWSDESTLKRWFRGPIVRTSEKFGFRLGLGA